MNSNPVIATTAVLAAMALVVLDAGITNVALPTISTSLEILPAKVILVASAYQLALLMGLLPAAHIAGRTGSRKLFIMGLVTFTAASLMAAAAPAFEVLVAARFIQGLGGAAILALGIPLLRATLGRDRLGSAIAWNALNVALCAAAGPAIGALIITIATWRWLFFVNLPLGVLAIVASFALPTAASRNKRIDVLSIALHAASAALLFAVFESIGSRPGVAIMLAVLAAGSIWLLLRREVPKIAPLLPLDLLRDRPFRLAASASTLCFIAHSAGQLALPFLLQHNLAQNVLASGAVIACWPLAVALTSPLASSLAARTNAGLLCAAGTFTLSIGLLAMAWLQHSLIQLAACAAVSGVGFGLFQVPNNRSLFFAAPEERSEAAGGMQGTARLAGQTTGGALVSLVFTWLPSESAPTFTLAVAASFALAAAIVSAQRAVSNRRQAMPCEV